jgi:hypothetical protein
MTDLERVQGIKVHGIQHMDEGAAFILCMDPETGTTFAVHPGETIGTALGRVKSRYRQVMGEARGGTQGLHR